MFYRIAQNAFCALPARLPRRKGNHLFHTAPLPPLVMVLLAAMFWGLPAVALAGPHPYPHTEHRPNQMKAPGPGSSMRLPLATNVRTNYHLVLGQPVESTAQPLMLGLLHFYRTVISPVNGDQSDVAPVHSLYAVQAVKTHGVLLGVVLTTERLIHEPDELRQTWSFVENGRTFYHDPLMNNTYWLWDWLQ